MPPIVRNIFAVIAGLIVGSFVNMFLIKISGKIIPPPPGAVLTTEEGLKAAMQLMQPKHFLFPFLAHALGTFVGAALTVLLAVSNKMRLALIIAASFFIGGAMMVYQLPSPLWFSILDLGGAYFPMGYLAGKLGVRK